VAKLTSTTLSQKRPALNHLVQSRALMALRACMWQGSHELIMRPRNRFIECQVAGRNLRICWLKGEDTE
jgi:hypothetical protein